MFRKTLATIAATGALAGIIAGTAGTATAATRHSDIYVKTTTGQWVPQDQLTAGEIFALDNEWNCAPVQSAILVDQPAYVGGYPVPVIEQIGDQFLVSVGNATTAQISAANFGQVGLTGIPSWLGPTAYTVNADGSYSCPK